MTRLYPIGLRLAGKRCLVVGAGPVAERKVNALLAADGIVHVVAPEATAAIRALAQAGQLTWTARTAQPDDLADCLVAIVCTDDRTANDALAVEAARRGVLVNVADAPEEGSIVSPAVLQREDVLIAVWSGGGGPVVSQLVRERVAGCIGAEWGVLSRVVARCRTEINRSLPAGNRAQFWRSAVDEALLALLRQGEVAGAEAALRERAVSHQPDTAPSPARDQPLATARSDTAPLQANCDGTSVGFTPLPDLHADLYHGFPGGLYPGGLNQPPHAYLAEGLARAERIQPLDKTGEPATDGKIVLLSIGMSNTTQEFSVFKREADADPGKNSRLFIVDGAQGGQAAVQIANSDAPFWGVATERLEQAGATPQQVQAVWLKEAIARPSEPFPGDAQRLQGLLKRIVQIMQHCYPNLQIVYLSSRIYAGYATTPLNPEPHAYEGGFAVKWLIEERIAGGFTGPWLAWGPYLWTDGMAGRRDGLIWECADVVPDGTHPSSSGRQKVAALLLQFFQTDQTAQSWFSC